MASQRQLRAVLLQKGREAAAADFFLALDDEGQVARQLGAGLEIRFNGLEVREVLAFVVAGAAAEERAAGDARLEGRRFPELERLGRLHVVMAIDHEMRAAAQPCALARGVLATTMGLPLVGQSRASRPMSRQCLTTHSAQARRSWRCCGWADTLGKRTYSQSSSMARDWFCFR